VYRLHDPERNDAAAAFAVFSEISVRAEGSFRLRLSLYELRE
jgi:hypothetical protein